MPPPTLQWAELGKFVKSNMSGLFFLHLNFEIFEHQFVLWYVIYEKNQQKNTTSEIFVRML